MGPAVDWFSKAIGTDSSFINAYVFLSNAYQLQGRSMLSKYWFQKAYERKDDLPTEEKLILDHLNAYYFGTPNEEIKYLKQLVEIDELNSMYWHQLAYAHYKQYEYEDALDNWEQIFKIHERWGTHFRNPFFYFLLGNTYHKFNEHEKEDEVLELGISLFPDNLYIMQFQAICALSQEELEKADHILSEYKSIRKNVIHCTESMISAGLGYIYENAELMYDAEAYYRKALELEPENLFRMNELAWFLIENDINVEEGVDITDKALEQMPDSWLLLDTKGWGIYKLGRYEEALTLIEESWKLKPSYNHSVYLHLEEVKQAIADQNNVAHTNRKDQTRRPG
jgi:tetratricopeptide (TPR) repeat protein